LVMQLIFFLLFTRALAEFIVTTPQPQDWETCGLHVDGDMLPDVRGGSTSFKPVILVRPVHVHYNWNVNTPIWEECDTNAMEAQQTGDYDKSLGVQGSAIFVSYIGDRITTVQDV
jgi:hypothetical protein